MVFVNHLLATKFIDGTFVGWPENRIFWRSYTLSYMRSGTLIPNNFIDFFNTSATTCENAILNFNLA